ncbi:uncharacterized protein LOC109861224 [Pseudomyrmex gracilis]|uniref:uncharacterized protein LOC109861224 n=1 Tax=Pseudomyrmex gracilis TaxID=219809 RepID=UPI000994E3F5|nr:uncharacterized protein LOC109861224 [Pseudomyrmex gracilis]
MRLYSRLNRGYHYILTVIDVLSKYAWAIPLTTIAEKFLITVYSNVKIAGLARLKVGDPVRVSKFKTVFDKGYTPNWTTKVFKISKIQTTYPVTYLLDDSRRLSVARGFYEYELHRVAHPDVYFVKKVLRKKGDKVYVKWLGLDKSYNSWINKTNVL